MKLTFVRKTIKSQVNNCPSLYRTDRDTFVVQGWRVSDPEALAQLDIPAHETVGEVPVDVLAEVAKALSSPMVPAIGSPIRKTPAWPVSRWLRTPPGLPVPRAVAAGSRRWPRSAAGWLSCTVTPT